MNATATRQIAQHRRDRWLHWALAAVVAAQFASRIAADGQDITASGRALLMGFHVFGGFATMALTIALMAARRHVPESNVFALWGHRVIYLALLVQGMSGIAAWFGLSPTVVMHRALSGAIMLLAIGHFVAALWHHLVRRDDRLRDMLGWGRGR